MEYGHLTSDPAAAGAALAALAAEPPPIRLPIPLPDVPVVVDDDGEPLVDAGRQLMCLRAYHDAGWPGTDPRTWLRAGVVSRLVELQVHLPHGFGLAIFDGWRSPTTVRALYDHYYGPGSTLEPGYLAPPEGRTPPHTTGGAVDLTLTWHGAPLALGTPFDEFTPRAHLCSFESEPGPVRALRRLLVHHMVDAGFAPFAEEWWHFSHGDEDWARWRGVRVANHGATSPGPDGPRR